MTSAKGETTNITTLTTHFTSTANSTPSCSEDQCHCNGYPCFFNETSSSCQCKCSNLTFGDSCIFGNDNTPINIDSETVPTRRVNISLRIMKNFIPEFENINSTQSKNFINTLTQQLETLCKKADSQNFKGVKIIALRNGSIIADSVAQYSYSNSESQISFVNNDLPSVLTAIFNNTENLRNLTISDLQPFISCRLGFANYTQMVIDGKWECVGPCVTNPDYCHQHGQCFNIQSGPTCRCDESPLEQYYGPQCELFRRGPGFYGVLFGVLAAGLLFLTALVVVVVDLIGRAAGPAGLPGKAGGYNLGNNLTFANETPSGVFRPLPDDAYTPSNCVRNGVQLGPPGMNP
ncbi:mucin-3B [Megalops cyprinoides]|uniref:mucin-3B n=1 Tax=Megalops cyprinoides TaxID=118141 RepID=UPI001863B846|nr:mucin-3B [Megalops cyprinoides]